MLILRGKAGKYALPGEQPRDWPRGALDEPPALEFARLRGYDAKVLDVIGYSGAGGQQVQMALAETLLQLPMVASAFAAISHR